MVLKKTVSIVSLSVLLFAGGVSSVAASGNDTFGSCLNPSVAASQENKGDRFGVVGTTKLYSGVDRIYPLLQGNVMQCLCQKNGDGIQTNWLRVGKMSKKEVEKHKNSGWTYIITGSTWGLKDEAYLAKNSEYSCLGNKETKVKGLASTGNEIAFYGLLIAGVFALTAGFFIKRVAQ